jgi:hypothetical protein
LYVAGHGLPDIGVRARMDERKRERETEGYEDRLVHASGVPPAITPRFRSERGI